jgi:Hint module
VVTKCVPVRTGDALAITEEGGSKRMEELSIGDRVMAVDSNGQVCFDDIFVFGHKDSVTVTSFVRLELVVLASGAREFIEATPDHFIPTVDHAVTMPNATHWRSARRMLRSANIVVGQFVWMVAGERLEMAQVTAITRVTKRGMYNPYTASGTIIVSGVVASVHSRWVLDDIFDYFNASEWLPAAYQVVFLPVRGVYGLLKLMGGPGLAEAIDDAMMLSHLAHSYPHHFVGANIGLFLLFALTCKKVLFGRGRFPICRGIC